MRGRWQGGERRMRRLREAGVGVEGGDWGGVHRGVGKEGGRVGGAVGAGVLRAAGAKQRPHASVGVGWAKGPCWRIPGSR